MCETNRTVTITQNGHLSHGFQDTNSSLSINLYRGNELYQRLYHTSLDCARSLYGGNRTEVV